MIDNAIDWVTTYPNFFLLFLGIGALGTLWHVFTFGKAALSASWPTVQGRIESSSVEEGLQSATSTRKEYGASVVYVYSVQGKTFRSKQIRFDGSFRTNVKELIETIVKRYPPNSDVQVRYNPNNPSEAVLEAGVPKPLWLFLAIDVSFVLIGIAGYLKLLPISVGK